MLRDFKKDLANAKGAEKIVLDTLASLASGYVFEDVSDQPQYYYKGDIKATAPNGEEIFIEVKNDSRIAETRNILCEEENYMKDGDYYSKGCMHNSGDYYCIVSASERKIYILDYKVLRQIYKSGEYKVIPHYDQICYCYLLELCRAKQFGALITVLDY